MADRTAGVVAAPRRFDDDWAPNPNDDQGEPTPGVDARPAPTSEPAPPNSLPDWYECQRVLDNAEFRKRATAGLEGRVLDTPPTTPEPTELHRFIYEYDDADPHRSAWFLHRLELVLAEARNAGVPPSDGRQR